MTGIEIRSWTIDPMGAPLAGALAPYQAGLAPGEGDAQISGTAAGLEPAQSRSWRVHGFRLVEIPVGLVSELEASLPHIDAVRRVWLGQPTRWSDLATRELESEGGALGGRPVRARASLSVRSWIEPGVGRRPIRLELALTGVPLNRSGVRPIVLRDLLLTHRLAPGVALVIVPAPPDEAWLPPDERGEGGADEGGHATPSPDVHGPDIDVPRPGATLAPLDPPGHDGVQEPEQAGPGPAPVRSLGEQMLIDPDRIASDPRRPSREVFVIVPSSR